MRESDVLSDDADVVEQTKLLKEFGPWTWLRMVGISTQLSVDVWNPRCRDLSHIRMRQRVTQNSALSPRVSHRCDPDVYSVGQHMIVGRRPVGSGTVNVSVVATAEHGGR